MLILGAALSGDSLPPIEAFCRPPEIVSPVLSPDGNCAAYIAPVQGKPMIILRDLTTGTAALLGSGENISMLAWKGNERLVSGGPFATPAILDIKKRTVTRVGSKDLLDAAYIRDYASNFSDFLVIANRKQVFVLNLNTDREDVFYESTKPNSGSPFPSASASFFVLNEAGVACAYLLRGDDSQQLFFREPGMKKFNAIKRWRFPEPPWLPMGASADGSKLYVLVPQSGDFSQLQIYDPQTDLLKPFLDQPTKSTIKGVLFSRNHKSVLGLVLAAHEFRPLWLDGDFQKIQMSLDAAFPSKRVGLLDFSLDTQVCLLEVSSPNAPSEWYVLNRAKRDLRLLVKESAPMPVEQLGATTAVEIPARDGGIIHGYLTTPKPSAAAPGPLILEPYPVPFSGSFYNGYDPEAQLFASRGYSLLRLNYRGVSGFGESYTQAGRGEMAGRIIDDINDAARWAVAQGRGHAGRICLYGEQLAGGFVLVAAGAAPDLYGGLVIKDCIADWDSYAGDRHKAYRPWFATTGGKYPSPLASVIQLKAPVLDIRRSKKTTDEKLQSAFRKNNKAYTAAGFLDPFKYHDDFDYRAFDAANMMTFLAKNLPAN